MRYGGFPCALRVRFVCVPCAFRVRSVYVPGKCTGNVGALRKTFGTGFLFRSPYDHSNENRAAMLERLEVWELTYGPKYLGEL